MSKTLVLIGGGHAHMTVMAELRAYTSRGHRVVLINPEPYHYYSGMGPGMLGGTYRPEEIRFHIKKMVEDRGGEYVQGRVVKILPESRRIILADGKELAYDIASCNTGSGVPMPPGLDLKNVTPVKPIAGLADLRQTLCDRLAEGPMRLLVVGSGPAGVEIAGNLRQLVTQVDGAAGIRLIVGEQGLLPTFPATLQQRAQAHLQRREIECIQEGRLTTLDGGRARLESGRELRYDHAIVATGVKPAELFSDSAMTTGPDGGMAVNRYLQSVDTPQIFGGGDCIHFTPSPLVKVGVYAVRQNPILHHNLLAALEGQPLKSFDPGGDYLLILNLGEGQGLLKKGRVVVEGKRAFAAKNWIDRRFMRNFQLSGELKVSESHDQSSLR